MTTSDSAEREHVGRPDRSAVRRGPLVAGLVVLVLAFATAWLAGLGAPAQPELFGGGGACQLAPCGELEDPARWRAAWLAIGVSALLAGVGLAVVASALPVRPVRSSVLRVLAACLMVLVALPVTVVTLALTALFTSVPFGVVVAATWAAAFAALGHLVVVVGPASRWSVLIAAAAGVAPVAVVMVWWQPWTLGLT